MTKDLMCSRYGCETTCCARLLPMTGKPICEECYAGLLAYWDAEQETEDAMDVDDVKADIQAFLDSDKQRRWAIPLTEEVKQEFNRLVGR